jgi:hypothetical protein
LCDGFPVPCPRARNEPALKKMLAKITSPA